MKRRVQTRLLLVFGTLFASVMLLAFIIVWQATRDNFTRQIDGQLDYIGTALQRQIMQRMETLQRETEILSRDYGFRSAVSTADPGTVISAMGNFGRRISIDRLQVYTDEGVLFADTADRLRPEGVMAEPGPDNKPYTRILMQGGEAYFYAFTPVLAPDLIGWVAGGLRVSDLLAGEIQVLLPGTPEVSFHTVGPAGTTSLLGTTLPLRQRAVFERSISESATGKQQLVLGNDRYIFRRYELESFAPDNVLVATVLMSLNDAHMYLQHISIYFLLVCAFGLSLVFAGAYVFSRSFTKPIRLLAGAAERIQEGDYSVVVPSDRADEFGFLATCFSQMAAGIEEREHRIREQGMHDALTDLPNRLYIEMWLSRYLAADSGNSRVTVALISIDRLAEVNYVLGHDVADRVIAEIGKLLKDIVRADDVISRVSSDTFGLAIPDMQAGEIMPVIRRVLNLFRLPVRIDEFLIDVTGCVGIAAHPDHAGTARDLLRAAEHALYVARGEHERFAFYESGRDSTSSMHLSLMGDLRNAIEHDELELWFQPQISVVGEVFSRVEALVRWPHPERGMIHPDLFITLAERTGEIHRLTRWVLETALAQLADWRARGLDLQVSVNLSACDLNNRQLPTMISELLHKYGIRTASLCVEITESAIMGDTESVLSVLRILRDSGVQVAIDDFGTGYSSLEYLARLPATELKIDRTFVMKLADERSDQLIVKSAIDLAHGLGLTVVAEGVENSQAAGILRQFGCDLLQGYAIGKPMPASDLERWSDEYQSGKSEMNDATPLAGTGRESHG